MAAEPSDDTLLEAIRARGDRDALGELLERHEAEVHRFASRMCRDPEDAKDVLQETLLAAARGARDFRGASSISTWLFTIARSFCIKKRRRSKFAPAHETSIDERPDAPSPAPQPDEAADDARLRAALDAAIASLEPKYREVLLLRDVEGFSAPEVAEVLGISVEAVKSRLHRARVSIRSAMAPWLEPVPPPLAGCPDIAPMFSRYLEGEIAEIDCERMREHVARCPACSAMCDSLRRTLGLCRANARGEVPPDVQKLVRDALRDLAVLGRPRAP